MSTTAQQTFDLAVARSSLNNPDSFPPAQAVRYIANAEKAAYLLAAKLNPEHFGKQADSAVRADHDASWTLSATPGGIGSIMSFDVAAMTGAPVGGIAIGDRLNWISKRWPNFALSPRVYTLRQILYGYEDELGIADTDFVTKVTVYYSELPAGPTAMGTTLSLEDEWIDLIVLPLARNFALRDQRAGEIASIDDELKMVKAMFAEHVGVFDGGTIRPVQSVPVRTALDSKS